MTYTYKEIVSKAKECKTNVEQNYKLTISTKWTYYICKAILNPKHDIEKIKFDKAPKPLGTYISRQINKNNYLKLAKATVKFIEKHKRLPNCIKWGAYKIRPSIYVYMFSRILVYYATHSALPTYVDVNSKAYTKPVETKNEVYNYFVKVFGKIGSIDEALSKIQGRGYGYYYDDQYSNHDAIDRMKSGKGVNCTDSCQVMFNILLQLIQLGKYKKVECLHVKCRGGDGHVRLRIALNDGSKIYRDPASVLDGSDITHNWCSNGTLIAIDPQWFKNNLNR